MTTGFLRWAARLGVGGALLVALLEDADWGPRDARASWAVACVLAAAILALSLPPMRRATRSVLGALDVLVPLGLLVTLEAFLPRAFAPWLWLWQSTTITLLQVSLAVTGWLVLDVAMAVAAGAWTTLLVLDLAAGRPVDLALSLHRLPRAFLPALAAGTVGHLTMLLVVGLAVFPVLAGGGIALMFAIVAVSVAWNFWTAGLLPIVLTGEGPILRRLRAGFASARGHVRAWALPVALQLALLGVVTFVSVTFTEETTSPGRSTSHTTHRTAWSANASWAGGYDGESKWYSAHVKALDAETRSVPEMVLSLGLLFVAVVVKLHVVRTLFPPPEGVPAPTTPPPPPEPFSPETEALYPTLAQMFGSFRLSYWPSRDGDWNDAVEEFLRTHTAVDLVRDVHFLGVREPTEAGRRRALRALGADARFDAVPATDWLTRFRAVARRFGVSVEDGS